MAKWPLSNGLTLQVCSSSFIVWCVATSPGSEVSKRANICHGAARWRWSAADLDRIRMRRPTEAPLFQETISYLGHLSPLTGKGSILQLDGRVAGRGRMLITFGGLGAIHVCPGFHTCPSHGDN